MIINIEFRRARMSYARRVTKSKKVNVCVWRRNAKRPRRMRRNKIAHRVKWFSIQRNRKSTRLRRLAESEKWREKRTRNHSKTDTVPKSAENIEFEIAQRSKVFHSFRLN